MAITWGPARTSGDNGFRLGYEFTQTPTTVGAGNASVNLNLKIYVGTQRSASDSTNTFVRSGSWGSSSGSISFSHSSSSSWSMSNVTLIYNNTISVSTSYTGTVSRSFGASLSGIAIAGGTASVSGSHTVGKRPYSPPAAPTSIGTAYVSDSQQNITWTRNATTGAPYDSQKIYRWDNVGGTYKHVANISGTATSYADTGTVANRRYRYIVRAVNSAGETSGNAGPFVSTTPAPVTNVSAVKTSSGDIEVTWNPVSGSATTYNVQRRQNEGSWINVGYVGNVGSWTHTSPSTIVSHQYQIAAVSHTDSPTLNSDYRLSPIVQLQTPPNPPTGLTPSGNAYDATLPIVFQWQHNPLDSSAQSGYGIRYRVNGGSWVTLSTVSTSSSQRIMSAGTFSNGSTIEWQARTRGAHATYSGYSASATFTTSAVPGANVTFPDGLTDVGSSRIIASWSYYDPEGTDQSAYQLQLFLADGTTLLETKSGSGDATSRNLTTVLKNGVGYILKVRVQDGSGLWSAWASQAFDVTYLMPPTPVLEAVWDPETASYEVSISNPVSGGGEADAVYNEVWRSVDGETFELIADNVSLNTSITDSIPVTNGTNTYFAVALSELGAAKESDHVLAVPPGNAQWFWLNGGGGFSEQIKLRYNPVRGRSFSRGKTLNNYAGREYPVETAGEQRAREFDLSFTVLGEDDSTVEEIEDFADLPSPLCLRTPGGTREFVSIEGTSASGSGVTDVVTFRLVQVAPPELPTIFIPLPEDD